MPLLGNVGSVGDVSSMAANVGVLNSVHGRHRLTSGNVDSVISKSGLVENVGLDVEIA